MLRKHLWSSLMIVMLVMGVLVLAAAPGAASAQEGSSLAVPAGRLLAADDGGLFTMLADGAEKTYLVEESESGCWLRDGAWSPDEQWVIYTRICGGNSATDWHAPERTAAVYAYDVAAGTSDELIPNDGTYQDYVGDWSPDGTQVVFYSNRDSEYYNVYLFDFASGETTQATAYDGDVGRASLDPTGRYLLYNRYLITTDDVRWEVRTLDLQTDTETRVAIGMTPQWSPDGRWIAYTTEGDTADVFVMAADCVLNGTECNPTSNARNITQTPGILERAPLWSPDQTQLVYLRDTNPEIASTTWDIYRQELRTGRLQRLTSTGSVAERHSDWEPLDATPVSVADQLPVVVRVISQSRVNLRADPSLNGDIVGIASNGQLLFVQGVNGAGDWYHVTLPEDGTDAWVFASLTDAVQGDPAALPPDEG